MAITTPKIDLSEQHAAADKSGLQKSDPAEWGRRLDAFIDSRRTTPVLPLSVMLRESFYDE